MIATKTRPHARLKLAAACSRLRGKQHDHNH